MKQHGLESVEFAPCLWGEKFGARLAREGKSIPTYGEARSPEQAVADNGAALWKILLDDPTYELSALAKLRLEDRAEHDVLENLHKNFSLLSSSKDLHSALVDIGLDHLVDGKRIKPIVAEVIKTIARSEGFQACPSAPIGGRPEHRDALARAVVAGLQKQALEGSMPLLDAPHRDELVIRIGRMLAAGTFSVITASLAPLRVLGTWQGRRERSSLTDATYPAAGDILRYQLHGKQLRDYLRDCIAAFPDNKVYVLAHSLGGVAAFETLIENDLPNVERLITFGSQAPFFYEIGALATLPLGDSFPSKFPAWSNFYDLNDPLSYVGEGVFGNHVSDHPIESGASFPASHGAYLHSTPFWKLLAALINHV